MDILSQWRTCRYNLQCNKVLLFWRIGVVTPIVFCILLTNAFNIYQALYLYTLLFLPPILDGRFGSLSRQAAFSIDLPFCCYGVLAY